MSKALNKLAERYAWFCSCSIVISFILFFVTITTPLLNSGDDAFFLYTLGGGYGEAPTSLLQYNYGWNYILGGTVQALFKLLPGVNWYTIILLFFHCAGCSAFLYVLVKMTRPVQALLLFSISFFFFEARQLLSLTYSGASLVAGIGAATLLLFQLQQKKVAATNTIFALILLLLAGMLRLQIIWLVVFLFSSLAVSLLNRSQLLRWCCAIFFVVASLWGLNKLHERYYIKNIPGWTEKEKFMQALVFSYNRQLVRKIPVGTFKDSTEQSLFFAGFLYDSVTFSTERVSIIGKKITRNRSLANREDRAGLYWFFVEMRVYILLFAVLLISLLVQQKFLPVKKWMLAFLAFLLTHIYLFVFLKITFAIHLGLLFFIFVALVMQFNKESGFLAGNKPAYIFMVLLMISLFVWIGVRLNKENDINTERRKRFLCALAELKNQPDTLFVATDDAFPLNYFYIWDTPRQYMAANLLYKDRLITHTYLQTLKRFNITDLEVALRNNKNVVLLGRALPALQTGDYPAKLSLPLPAFHCLEVRQLKRSE